MRCERSLRSGGDADLKERGWRLLPVESQYGAGQGGGAFVGNGGNGSDVFLDPMSGASDGSARIVFIDNGVDPGALFF
jgi:hypothetical protein